jgi:arylsulfatase A-like enzyme
MGGSHPFRPGIRSVKTMTRRTFFGSAAGASLLAASHRPCRVSAAERPPNVVLLVLDTVRADHLGCYGYARNTTSNIDAFAAQATRYTRAKATAPWTLPSHASMFTGRYSFEHGAHWHRNTASDDDPTQDKQLPTSSAPLAERFLTLAETFDALGYDTGGFSANTAFTTARRGIPQGFVTYEVEELPGIELNRKIHPWLSARGEKPFFMFVNYMDAHLPYNNIERTDILGYPLTNEDSRDLTNRLEHDVLNFPSRPIPKDLASLLIDQYDMGVANADHAFGQLWKQMADLGLMENTIFIVTSDHGEYFGEHHLTGHTKDVYEEVINIPLLIRQPGLLKPATSHQLVSLAHMPSLIFSALPNAMKPPPELVKHVPGESIIVAEAHYTQPGMMLEPKYLKRFDRVRFAVYSGNMKYIESSDGRHELFNLGSDPMESNNRIMDQADSAEAMQAMLDEFRSRHRLDDAALRKSSAAQPPTPLTPEEIEQMRALGYLE